MSWLVAFIGGLFGKIWGPLFAWIAAYQAGRNAEAARVATERAKQSESVAEAQSRMSDVVVDDAWLHGSGPAKPK